MTFPINVDATWVNLASVQMDAGELRRADAVPYAGEGGTFGVHGGIARHGDSSLLVSVDGSDNVTIQPGAVLIPGNAVLGSGPYRTGIASAVTGALSARNATNPRIDLVVFRQLDTDVVGTHGAYTARIDVIAGTPSATPAVPALPSMAVELGRITVPATGGGASTVDLTYRTFATAAGATMPVPTTGMLPASAAAYQKARDLSTGLEWEFVSGTWRPIVRKVLVKAADQSVANTTTLATDNDLTFGLVSGNTYVFDAHLIVSVSASSSGSDFKIGVLTPGGGGFNMSGAGPEVNMAAGSNIGYGDWTALSGAVSATLSYGLNSTGTTSIHVYGSLTAAATGPLTLRWAQNVAVAATTTVRSGSWMRIERV